MNIAEEAFTRVPFRIVGGGQQIAAENFALEEKGDATGGGGVVAMHGKILKFGVESIA